MKTLANTKIGNTPVHVRHIKSGETGWAVQYGRPSFGGIRQSIFSNRNEALNADVSDDVGSKMVRRDWITDLPQWQVI